MKLPWLVNQKLIEVVDGGLVAQAVCAADARFIVAACNALPALLDAAERARGLEKALEEVIAWGVRPADAKRDTEAIDDARAALSGEEATHEQS